MLDAMCLAFLIEGMADARLPLTGPREVIGERLTIVGQYGLDLEKHFLLHAVHGITRIIANHLSHLRMLEKPVFKEANCR